MSPSKIVEQETITRLRTDLPLHVNNDEMRIAQPNVLRAILTPDSISKILEEFKENGKIECLDWVRTRLAGEDQKSCIVIFAMLLLVDKGHKIQKVLEGGITDDSLPLIYYDSARPTLFTENKNGQASKELKCFEDLGTFRKLHLCKLQWYLTTPYMSVVEPYSTPYERRFRQEITLPWTYGSGDGQKKHNERSAGFGGYSAVYRRHIDDKFHGFRKVLEHVGLSTEEGLFALKVLKPYSDEEKDAIQREFQKDPQRLKNFSGFSFGNNTDAFQTLFENERKQLKNFNGVVHNHLVTLLAAFEREEGPAIESCFIFPWAKCDLSKYMEEQRDPDIKWVAEQLDGLVDALDTIHNPSHLTGSFGRHGDLKPDNILWYAPYRKDKGGILVLSDMGFTAVNSEVSRSMQTNGKPRTPIYRPPEMDIKGAFVTPRYDIWSLGCVFLEIMTWILGGPELNHDFKESRKILYDGVYTPMFFTFIDSKPAVNPKVTEWMVKLRSHRKSTKFVCDVVEVIEKEMIVPLDKGRTSVDILKGRFHEIKDRCNNSAYYTPAV